MLLPMDHSILIKHEDIVFAYVFHWKQWIIFLNYKTEWVSMIELKSWDKLKEWNNHCWLSTGSDVISMYIDGNVITKLYFYISVILWFMCMPCKQLS